MNHAGGSLHLVRERALEQFYLKRARLYNIGVAHI